MKKTILVTGASSGIGKATVKYFAERNWNVAATMRKPENETELHKLPNVKIYKLDVMDDTSIKSAIDGAINDFGTLDVVLNNAGYGAVGPFEAASKEQVQRQFDTNVFGVMNVTRAILPYFRQRKDGIIINVSSMGGRITFPIYSLYHGTKWAVEGFTEALQFELKQFGIRVKLIEPGAIKTDFYDRSMDVFKKEGLTEYDAYVNLTMPNMQKAGADAPGPEVVAQKIFKAATDGSKRLRYPVGNQAPFLLWFRSHFPESWFYAVVRMVVEKK